ncbi:hypothetical protein, partial [Vibrio atlanticus]|uniref:hypothetical protein n=1 Tax=Vibrio atlanticus TaxID=693153 RepID=UPI003CE84D09
MILRKHQIKNQQKQQLKTPYFGHFKAPNEPFKVVIFVLWHALILKKVLSLRRGDIRHNEKIIICQHKLDAIAY